jgi:hypothetical protein
MFTALNSNEWLNEVITSPLILFTQFLLFHFAFSKLDTELDTDSILSQNKLDVLI